MRAALLTAPLVTLQHFSLVFGQPVVLAIALMIFLLVVSIPLRAFLGWTYNRTGSLFLVGFMHAAGNAAAGSSGFADGFLPRLYAGEDFVGVLHLVAFALIGAVVIVATRARLGLPSRRESPVPATRVPDPAR